MGAFDNFSQLEVDKAISGGNGDGFTASGTGDKVFEADAYGMVTREAVTISHLYVWNPITEAYDEVSPSCKGVALEKGETVFFGHNIRKITTSTGGLVKYFKSR